MLQICHFITACYAGHHTAVVQTLYQSLFINPSHYIGFNTVNVSKSRGGIFTRVVPRGCIGWERIKFTSLGMIKKVIFGIALRRFQGKKTSRPAAPHLFCLLTPPRDNIHHSTPLAFPKNYHYICFVYPMPKRELPSIWGSYRSYPHCCHPFCLLW